MEEEGDCFFSGYASVGLSDFLKDMPGFKCQQGDSMWVFWKDPTLPRSDLNSGELANTGNTDEAIVEKLKYVMESITFRYSVPTFLFQFWAAVTVKGQCFLTTWDQPFALTGSNRGLFEIRKKAMGCRFVVDGDEEAGVGLLAHAFRNQCCVSTPNVNYYSNQEYPQGDPVATSEMWGCLALPLFDQSVANAHKSCIGVLEVLARVGDRIMEPGMIIEIHQSLKEVDLKCPGFCGCRQVVSEEHSEVEEMLRKVQEAHGLYFAQVWVACRQCSVEKGGCSNLDTICLLNGLYKVYSEANFICCDGLRVFMNACQVLHLQKGQGVVGQAYSSRKPCFCRDITQFTEIEYPLINHARYAGLVSCFAICLNSTSAFSNIDYMVELFFAPGDGDAGNPRVFLDSLMMTLRNFPNFKVAAATRDQELGGDVNNAEVIELPMQTCQTIESPPGPGTSQVGSSNHEQLMVDVEDVNSGSEAVVIHAKESNTALSDPQHRKTQACISYEDLEQHFGRKLKDAAESLGVSRSTLKRICRQHGIFRWPLRKRHRSGDHQLPKQTESTVAATMPPNGSTTVPRVSTLTVKAKYENIFMKFQLPFSSGMAELEEQLSKRLKKSVGTCNVCYLDEKGDPILIACDEDLQNHISTSRALGMSTIEMVVLPVFS